jgi:hypothetical protein
MPSRASTMRTSDAERQRVADFLRDACADGRLSPEELEHRLERLFAEGTVADIERLVWDLPGGGAVVPRLGFRPVRASVPMRRRPSGHPGALALICAGVAALIIFSLPPVLAVVALAILLGTLVGVATLAVALAPAGLFLLGLAWAVNRFWRGRFGPPPRRLGGWGRHPFL